MKQILRNLFIILALLIIAAPIAAQDGIGDLLPDNPQEFENLTALVYQGIIIMAMLLIYRSVPPGAIDRFAENAAKTPNKWDDILAGFLRLLPQPTLTEEPLATLQPPQPDTGLTPYPILLDVPVNMNHTLMQGVTSSQWLGGRNKDIPAGYTINWREFVHNDKHAPPPEIHIHEQHGGMKIELSHRRGILTIDQHLTNGVVRPNQPYMLEVHGIAKLNLKPDPNLPPENLHWSGRLIDGDNQLVVLPPQPVTSMNGSFEVQWAIQTADVYQSLAYQLDLVIGNKDSVPFDDDSAIVLTAIEFKPVSGYAAAIIRI